MNSFCYWGTRDFPRGRVLQRGYGVATGYRVIPVGRYSIGRLIRAVWMPLRRYSQSDTWAAKSGVRRAQAHRL